MSAITNRSNATNATYAYADYSSLKTAADVEYALLLLMSIVGTPVNLWFLAALLSSADLRSRFRNKIICNNCILHLVTCVIIIPVASYYYSNYEYISCVQQSMLWHLYFLIELAGNWQLVILIAVFLAQITDFDPTSKLSSGAATLGTVGLLAFPWAASLVTVPVITHAYWKYSSFQYYDCMGLHFDSAAAFRSIDTAAPIILAVVLVIIAAFFKYRRFHLRNSSRSMHVELIGRGPEIDNTLFYVVAVAVAIVCDLPQLLVRFDVNFPQSRILQWLIVVIVSDILSEIRVILMAITWLLLPDVRQRIKTWRPWYRTSPGIDLTLTYTQETTAGE
ncbi:hypothetical protein BsWGS_23455 [Bradybaena similaris]